MEKGRATTKEFLQRSPTRVRASKIRRLTTSRGPAREVIEDIRSWESERDQSRIPLFFSRNSTLLEETWGLSSADTCRRPAGGQPSDFFFLSADDPSDEDLRKPNPSSARRKSTCSSLTAGARLSIAPEPRESQGDSSTKKLPGISRRIRSILCLVLPSQSVCRSTESCVPVHHRVSTRVAQHRRKDVVWHGLGVSRSRGRGRRLREPSVGRIVRLIRVWVQRRELLTVGVLREGVRKGRGEPVL